MPAGVGRHSRSSPESAFRPRPYREQKQTRIEELVSDTARRRARNLQSPMPGSPCSSQRTRLSRLASYAYRREVSRRTYTKNSHKKAQKTQKAFCVFCAFLWLLSPSDFGTGESDLDAVD